MTFPLELWQIDCRSLSDADRQTFRAAMTAEECAKADAYKRSEDRMRSEVGRGVLRLRLAHLTGQSPQSFQMAMHPAGKPYWTNLECPFNLSHSADFVVVAIGGDAEIGIDIQKHEPRIDDVAIAGYALSADEQQMLHDTPADKRRDLFFTFWVLREAALKATGQGVFQQMRNVSALPLPTFANWSPAPGFGMQGLMTLRLNAPIGYDSAIACISTIVSPGIPIQYNARDLSQLQVRF